MARSIEILRPDPIHPKGRQVEVIDVDFHFHADFSSIHRYLKDPFRTKLTSYPPRAKEYDGRYALSIEDSGGAVQGKATRAEEVLRVLDKIGVTTVILGPAQLGLPRMFNEAFITAITSAYNDYLIQEVFPVSKRIKGYILINQRDPESAAREIRRVAGNASFVGVYCEYGPYEPVGSVKYDPMYDALAEYDLPLVLHGAGFWPIGSPYSTGARTWVELLGISWPALAQVNMGSMIFQGLFDKYPDQKVLIQEAGLWWIIDFMLRMDAFYLDHPGDIQLVERKLESGGKFLEKLPSEYVVENFRFATQPISRPKSKEHFKWLLELCHAKKLFLYSSDWPHATFDPVNWVFESGAISDELGQQILNQNARNLFTRLQD